MEKVALAVASLTMSSTRIGMEAGSSPSGTTGVTCGSSQRRSRSVRWSALPWTWQRRISDSTLRESEWVRTRDTSSGAQRAGLVPSRPNSKGSSDGSASVMPMKALMPAAKAVKVALASGP